MHEHYSWIRYMNTMRQELTFADTRIISIYGTSNTDSRDPHVWDNQTSRQMIELRWSRNGTNWFDMKRCDTIWLTAETRSVISDLKRAWPCTQVEVTSVNQLVCSPKADKYLCWSSNQCLLLPRSYHYCKFNWWWIMWPFQWFGKL